MGLKKYSVFLWGCLSFVIVLVTVHLVPSWAQEVPHSEAVVAPDAGNDTQNSGIAPELLILRNIEIDLKKKKMKDVYERSSVPSLVFLPSQYALLKEARVGFNTRVPTNQELNTVGNKNDPGYRPSSAIRDIKLAGIAFNTPDDWTIWLNNIRITPEALPPEAIDLRVYKDFVEVKWYDSFTSRIYPIRLRVNQKFNLDARVVLPGT